MSNLATAMRRIGLCVPPAGPWFRRRSVAVTRVLTLFLILWSGLAFTPAAARPASADRNLVAAFLVGAERQAETDEQRQEIARALTDALRKPISELRQLRYADYAGKPETWSLPQLLQHYFVPRSPVTLDDERFFRDLTTADARAAVRKQLNAVSRALKRSGAAH